MCKPMLEYNTDFNYQLAEEVEGLFGQGGVLSTQTVKKQGAYAPKTKSNNYFIYLHGRTNEKILAHNFAHIRNPRFY